jgi:hypothetical protein
MHCAASVAGPRAFEGDLQRRSDADDVGLALGKERRDDLEALDQKALLARIFLKRLTRPLARRERSSS